MDARLNRLAMAFVGLALFFGAPSCILPEVTIVGSGGAAAASQTPSSGNASSSGSYGSSPSVIASCDPVYPTDPTASFASCGYGQSCYLNGSSGAVCAPAGPRGFMNGCQNDVDCGEGMFCDYDYGNICNYWCYSLDDCPSGSSDCYAFAVVSNQTVGVCEW